MRVLVTGATGLLGSHIAAALCDRRASVVCLVRDEVADSQFSRLRLGERVTVVRGRLEDHELLERVINEHECEAVFHCAALLAHGSITADELMSHNAHGTRVLAEIPLP